MEGVRGTLDAAARWLVASAGFPGLFVVAFCDSSFLSLPEVNDLLVVTMAINRPERWWAYGLVAAAGSLAGCLLLHAIGKKGGQALLLRRLRPERLERLQAQYRRFDLLFVLVPALLPPPAPFKIFVLSSGVFGMRGARFALAVGAGRAARYLSEAWLAARYGDRVFAFLETWALELALGALAGLGAAWLVRRAHARGRASAVNA